MARPKGKVVCVALVVSLLALGHTANAAVVLLTEFRGASADASVTTAGGTDGAATSRNSLGDFADFDELVEIELSLENASATGTAQQVSQISTTTISASGAAAASATVATADPSFSTFANVAGYTNLSVDFAVTTPQLFDLSGVLSSLVSSGSAFGEASVSLRSQDGSFNLSIGTPFSGDQLTPFDLSGTLFPNVYTLSAIASMSASAFDVQAETGATDFAFNFSVANVPIPASVWLFGSGLLGLLVLARSKPA